MRRFPGISNHLAASAIVALFIYLASASAARSTVIHRIGAGANHRVRPTVCCGFTQSAFSGVATAIATNGGAEYILDNSNYSANGHALYKNVSGSWVLQSSPGGVQVAADTSGHPYLLTSGGTVYWDNSGVWTKFSSQNESMSYIGSVANPTYSGVTAVGTIVRDGKGYGAFYCTVIASSSGSCSSAIHGSGSPLHNYLAFVDGPLTTSSNYDQWAVNGDENVYENKTSSWVQRGTLQPESFSVNGHGTYALDSSGSLKQWNGSSWVTVSAPAATVVSVGPSHVWLLDSSGNIYWK